MLHPLSFVVANLLCCYVSEPVTIIVGGPDIYINTGSTVNLTCVVRNSPEPPSTIIWTHNHQVRATVLQLMEGFSLLHGNF